MSDRRGVLHELAAEAGVSVDWRDARGEHQTVEPEVLRKVLNALGFAADDDAAAQGSLDSLRSRVARETGSLVTGVVRHAIDVPLPDDVPAGDFRLELDIGGVVDGQYRRKDARTVTLPGISVPGYHQLTIGPYQFTLAIAPARCFGVEDLGGKQQFRETALAVQVYSLRRKSASLGAPGGSGGIGDFTALAEFAREAAQRGVAGVAISPMHAMFGADPRRYSPYGPSSRLFLNVLYIDPAELFGQPAVALAVTTLGLSPELMRLDSLSLIDWPAVSRARLAVLRHLYQGFPESIGTRAHESFLKFREEGGQLLEQHGRFEALHGWLLEQGKGEGGWREWPPAYRDPGSADVQRFAQENAQEVTFHIFLQWLADRGLARAQSQAREAGMQIGLIADLAVGTDPSGSHAWSRQDEILGRLSPGAPPDVYNQNGQAWGLTAFSPTAMQRNGFRAFIEMLRASLKYAGGIRVDHALGLSRMWLVPEGASPKEGAYVNYPFEDMMRLLAIESWRHRTIVIGENLGTVPEGFDQRIAEGGMLGMQVLWFERQHFGDGAPFKAPQHWSKDAVAMSTTHDLPTIAGWWVGKDIEWRTRLGLFGQGTNVDSEWHTRRRDREQLVQAFDEAGLDVDGLDPAGAEAPVGTALAYLGATRCPLVVVPIEDLLALQEQPNLPGTVDTHPNWRRRLGVDVDTLFDDPETSARLHALLQARKPS